MEALKATFDTGASNSALLNKLAAILKQAYQRHSPIPGDVHESLTDWLSKCRASDRERLA